MPAAELVVTDDPAESNFARINSALDRIEALGMKLAADRDEMQVRLSAAALFLRHAIAAATDALDGYDHRQSHLVHDGIVEALAHLRTAQRVLEGTPPETKEALSQRRIRRH